MSKTTSKHYVKGNNSFWRMYLAMCSCKFIRRAVKTPHRVGSYSNTVYLCTGYAAHLSSKCVYIIAYIQNNKAFKKNMLYSLDTLHDMLWVL